MSTESGHALYIRDGVAEQSYEGSPKGRASGALIHVPVVT